ncbi:MAG: hypothetical protein IJ560_02750 [Alphaproteobacteria bacterium]|nr:hypothetical protein [Alphaproteobacteria bacterium]
MSHRFVGLFILVLALPCVAHADANSDIFMYDTSDPLYLPTTNDFLSETALTYSDDILRLGQQLSYGINDRLTILGNLHYQIDFDGPADGFSSFDVGGKYRLARSGDNSAHIIADAIAGLRFGGTDRVRTPWFADHQYYAGLRVGRRWTGLTLAGTIKSSWIFDDKRGMAYIDFVPEAYFRLIYNWRIGTGFTFRKATNPHYDQDWLNLKLIREYGRTQYVGMFDYEIDDGTVQVGFRVNILF